MGDDRCLRPPGSPLAHAWAGHLAGGGSLIGAIMHGGHAFVVGAIRAAKKVAPGFHTVADDSAAAVLAFWRERVNGTFETIEVMRDPVHQDLDGLVVIVAANFTIMVHMRILARVCFPVIAPVDFQVSVAASKVWSARWGPGCRLGSCRAGTGLERRDLTQESRDHRPCQFPCCNHRRSRRYRWNNQPGTPARRAQ